VRSACIGAAAIALFLGACSTLESAPGRQRPTRPGEQADQTAATPSQATARKTAQAPVAAVRVPKTEWVSARSFASRMGIQFAWIEEGRRFRLKSGSASYEFELDTRECDMAGLRVFLGEAVRMNKGEPSFSRIDEQTLLLPMIRPGVWQKRIPALHTVMIDPGHGGNDSGKVNARLSLQEKQLTLDTALRLKKLLEAQGFRVLMTRSTDRFVELADRAEMTERAGADIFVSIHFNSVEDSPDRVTGVEVYTMSPRYQLSADQTPDPVNVPVLNPGNRFDHWNTVLGAAVHRSLLKDLKVPDRGFKRGRLAVLRLAECPAVLVESGYLSNDAEARKLSTPKYRQRIAEALADGISDYSIALEAARRTQR
jgi:N-acetylmuramoyl-L-alanine amidase